jgi:hypothetical protein
VRSGAAKAGPVSTHSVDANRRASRSRSRIVRPVAEWSSADLERRSSMQATSGRVDGYRLPSTQPVQPQQQPAEPGTAKTPEWIPFMQHCPSALLLFIAPVVRVQTHEGSRGTLKHGGACRAHSSQRVSFGRRPMKAFPPPHGPS